MGKKDEYQYDYLDDYERFADQVNGALFRGRQLFEVIRYGRDKEQLHRNISQWRTGRRDTIC